MNGPASEEQCQEVSTWDIVFVTPREKLDIWERVSMQGVARAWVGRAHRKQLGTLSVSIVHFRMN